MRIGRKPNFERVLVLAAACLLFLVQACGSTKTDAPAALTFEQLGAEVELLMEGSGVAALAAAIVQEGELVWTHGFGVADVRSGRLASADTLFQIASISKTVTVTVILQLVEEGKLDLDADINLYLPFEVSHPKFPSETITLRQLLTHSSGILDDWNRLDATAVLDKDYPGELRASLESYLVPGGDFYDVENNYSEWGPGAYPHYSNVGIALAALMAESVTRVPFEVMARERIFVPLGMGRTSFRLADIALDELAVPHGVEDGNLVAIGHHGYIDFPSGTMRTSVSEFCRFLLCVMAGGELDGVRLLEEETVAEMLSVQDKSREETQGLVWFLRESAGRTYWGHDGGDIGVMTQMQFSPEDNCGVVLFMTGQPSPKRESALLKMLSRAAFER